MNYISEQDIQILESYIDVSDLEDHRSQKKYIKDHFYAYLKEIPNYSIETLYRGYSFKYGRYDLFKKTLKDALDGNISINDISSWSLNMDISQHFFFGYSSSRPEASLLISTKIQPRTALYLNHFDFSVEDECILPPGRFKINLIGIFSIDEFGNKHYYFSEKHFKSEYNHLLMKAVKLGKVHHSLDEFLNIVQDRSKTLRSAYAN